MGKSVKFFLATAVCVFLIQLMLQAQDSTHVIRVRDITPRESFLSKLKGELTFAPHYSSEIGAGVAFTYVTPANITLVGDIASQGYAMFGVIGNHAIPPNRWDLDYRAFYSYTPTDFWGVGYENGANDTFKGEYDKRKLLLQIQLLRNLGKGFQIGPVVGWEWIDWEKLSGGRSNALGYGIVAVYDTRDSRVAPSEGIYLKFLQSNYTDFSAKPFYATSIQFDTYRQVWDGGVLAFDLLGQFTYGAVPWTMLPTIGGVERMRGYYRGRYIDNNAVSGQLELRQHIWEVLGGAAWVGVANVWGKGGKFNLQNSLPGAGVGLRLKLKEGILLRFDYGFGKNGQNGFVLGLNEAF